MLDLLSDARNIAERHRYTSRPILLTASSAASPEAYPGGGGGPELVPPTSPPDVVAGYRLAHLGDRFLAVVLDTLIGATLSDVISMWSAVKWGGVTASGFLLEGKATWVSLSLTLLAGFLYYWLLEATAGATLGKAIAGIQVRQTDGQKCGLRPALLRNLLRIVDAIPFYFVGFLVALLSRKSQRVGDHVAGTVVVDHPIARRARAALAILWLVCISASITGAWALHRGAPVTPTQIKLVSFEWTETEDGPARATASYKPGDEIFARYSLVGFTTDSQGVINVTLAFTVVDPVGLPLHETWTKTIRTAITEPDTPVNGNFKIGLTEYVPGGSYKVIIKAHDAVRNSDAEFAQTFTVVPGPAILPANQLEIRNFQFSTSAGGPPFSPAVYQPGQTVHYSYQLFGLRFRDDQTDLHIAQSVIGPDGQTVLDRPVNVNKTFVYHPDNFFLPVWGYLNVPSSAKKGTYIVRFVITDKVAGKTLNSESSFEVR